MHKKVEDENRRKFLKFALIGTGVIAVGKVLGPSVSKMINGPDVEHNFNNFRTVENKNGLTIYDKTGEEIFQIDNSK